MLFRVADLHIHTNKRHQRCRAGPRGGGGGATSSSAANKNARLAELHVAELYVAELDIAHIPLMFTATLG